MTEHYYASTVLSPARVLRCRKNFGIRPYWSGRGAIEVALAFSQRREIFPRHGAPRFFSIFFDLVLDPHNCRRHFRIAGSLSSNSRCVSLSGDSRCDR
jgi:hypothetical protein